MRRRNLEEKLARESIKMDQADKDEAGFIRRMVGDKTTIEKVADFLVFQGLTIKHRAETLVTFSGSNNRSGVVVDQGSNGILLAFGDRTETYRNLQEFKAAWET